VRAAAIESRHLWQPHAEALDEADAQLARLSLANAAPAAAPAVPRGLPVAALGGLVWGAAAALRGGGAWRGNDAASGQQQPRVRLAALACLTGVIVWGVALLSA
jgi:hypothetical protein